MVEPKSIQDNRSDRPPEEFPCAMFPTVFADGASGYVRGPVMKFFLYRTDPNAFGRGGIVRDVVQAVFKEQQQIQAQPPAPGQPHH
jgi:hypothetical protein